MKLLNIILTQIEVQGLNDAAEQSTLMSVLVTCILILSGVLVFIYKQNIAKSKTIETMSKDHAKEIQNLQSNHIDKLEGIRKEVLDRDDKRSKQQLDTEKEILSILNGLTQILELGEAKGKTEKALILDKLNDINSKLNSTIDTLIKKK